MAPVLPGAQRWLCTQEAQILYVNGGINEWMSVWLRVCLYWCWGSNPGSYAGQTVMVKGKFNFVFQPLESPRQEGGSERSKKFSFHLQKEKGL